MASSCGWYSLNSMADCWFASFVSVSFVFIVRHLKRRVSSGHVLPPARNRKCIQVQCGNLLEHQNKFHFMEQCLWWEANRCVIRKFHIIYGIHRFITVRLQVLTAVPMKIMAFWVVTSWNSEKAYRFGESYHLHLQDWKVSQTRSQHAKGAKLRRCVLLQFRVLCELQSVTDRRTIVFITMFARTLHRSLSWARYILSTDGFFWNSYLANAFSWRQVMSDADRLRPRAHTLLLDVPLQLFLHKQFLRFVSMFGIGRNWGQNRNTNAGYTIPVLS
jgi:hypothetical protein